MASKTKPRITPGRWADEIESSEVEASIRDAEDAAKERSRDLEFPPPYRPAKKRPKLGKTILVVPDSHAQPDTDLRRYEWLGRMVCDIKPDVVLDIGDWWDCGSLEQFSKKGSQEYFSGRSYWMDIDAGLRGRLSFARELHDYNKRRKPADRVAPRLVSCIGNHEHRITTFLNSDPQGFRFRSLIGLEDLRNKELGWEEIPFLQIVNIAGINFSHYFVSGVMSRPVSGVQIASSLVQKQLGSCVMGHSHTFDLATRTSVVTGRHVHGLVVGVYSDFNPAYAGPATALWRRGIAVLRDCDQGDFSLDWWSMNRIQAHYA